MQLEDHGVDLILVDIFQIALTHVLNAREQRVRYRLGELRTELLREHVLKMRESLHEAADDPEGHFDVGVVSRVGRGVLLGVGRRAHLKDSQEGVEPANFGKVLH